MTTPADLVLTNAEVHTLTDPDETAGAVAVRDGRIVRVGDRYEVEFLAGVETRVVDCEGRVVLPGFVDAHTHLPMVGRRLVNADLGPADSAGEAVERLREHAAASAEGPADGDDAPAGRDAVGRDGDGRDGDAPTSREAVGRGGDWLLGFGYDESAWEESRYLRRSDLDRVSRERPVAAFREDMHVASLNSVALDRLADEMPGSDVCVADGEDDAGDPTGVVVEDAADAVWSAVAPGRERMAALVRAAQARANELGVTGVHDMVRRSAAPAVYRDLDLAGELTVRVRVNYWADHLDALDELGLRPGHGSEMVRTGAVKTFSDGSIGGHTAKLSTPYADDPDERGEWVVAPDELREVVHRADAAGRQVAVHAIGDEAIAEALDAFAAAGSGGDDGDDGGREARHRVEHAEVLTDDLVARLGATDVVVSAQPNFLKWAREDGLYAARLGDERRLASNRYRALLDAGAALAFGSDCMPLSPLFGVQQAVTAPGEGQRLSVTEALRAYTRGSASAGFDEGRLGTVERGKLADLVVLERSPWEVGPDEVGDVGVAKTIVGGEVVYDGTAD